MKIRPLLPVLLLAGTPLPVPAYPPAPFHQIFGTVRDDHGNPLGSSDATITLIGAGNVQIVAGPTDPDLGAGINYSLAVPLDAGKTTQLYTLSALQPAWPFTLQVVRGGIRYVPIEMKGTSWNIGQPATSTRIDLTLGIDSDSDGLPDAWEEELMRTDPDRRYTNLAQILPGQDLDGDGLSNLQEYVAGTYALDAVDGLFLEIKEVREGMARLQFLAVAKRTYQVKTADDPAEFESQKFSFQPGGTDAVPSFRATETKLMDVYVPVGQAPRKLFRLFVE